MNKEQMLQAKVVRTLSVEMGLWEELRKRSLESHDGNVSALAAELILEGLEARRCNSGKK